jgi:hypothetical protein
MGQHKKHLDWRAIGDDAALRDSRGRCLAGVYERGGSWVATCGPTRFPTRAEAIDHVERIVAQRHMPLFLTGRLVFHSHL